MNFFVVVVVFDDVVVEIVDLLVEEHRSKAETSRHHGKGVKNPVQLYFFLKNSKKRWDKHQTPYIHQSCQCMSCHPPFHHGARQALACELLRGSFSNQHAGKNPAPPPVMGVLGEGLGIAAFFKQHSRNSNFE